MPKIRGNYEQYSWFGDCFDWWRSSAHWHRGEAPSLRRRLWRFITHDDYHGGPIQRHLAGAFILPLVLKLYWLSPSAADGTGGVISPAAVDVATSQGGKAVLSMPPLETSTARGSAARRRWGSASWIMRYEPKSRCEAKGVSSPAGGVVRSLKRAPALQTIPS